MQPEILEARDLAVAVEPVVAPPQVLEGPEALELSGPPRRSLTAAEEVVAVAVEQLPEEALEARGGTVETMAAVAVAAAPPLRTAPTALALMGSS